MTFATAPVRAGAIDEVWVGGFAHDISDRPPSKESSTQDMQIEIDTTQPRALRFLGAPHLNATAAFNTRGQSNLYAVGLAWDHRVLGQLFASLQFGIGYTNGIANPPAGPAGDYDRRNRLLLGSHALFREAAGLNWNFASHWAAGLQYAHASNGHILGHSYNQGINDLGMRLGYRF